MEKNPQRYFLPCSWYTSARSLTAPRSNRLYPKELSHFPVHSLLCCCNDEIMLHLHRILNPHMGLLHFQVRWVCLPVHTPCTTIHLLHGTVKTWSTLQGDCARGRWEPWAGLVAVWVQVTLPSPAAPAALSVGPGSATAQAQHNVSAGKRLCQPQRVQVLGSTSTLILFTPARLSSHIQCSLWWHSDMFCLNEGTAPSTIWITVFVLQQPQCLVSAGVETTSWL